MSTIAESSLLTVPDLVAELDSNPWNVRRAIDRLGLGFRLRGYRVLERKDVALLRQELDRTKKGPPGQQPEGPEVRSQRLAPLAGGVRTAPTAEVPFSGHSGSQIV